MEVQHKNYQFHAGIHHNGIESLGRSFDLILRTVIETINIGKGKLGDSAVLALECARNAEEDKNRLKRNKLTSDNYADDDKSFFSRDVGKKICI
ncbi:CLUMA_CG009727, isoform A [Clunio marinus]|uniref:CLUMA_CG009727, isoform A n=1 Tax=Clunio marinus TaxID=568069 RepID=A0A1J1I9Q7_9DIPT|nr:CLUMA_CG009727, isoform A [Clunio marinus]